MHLQTFPLSFISFLISLPFSPAPIQAEPPIQPIKTTISKELKLPTLRTQTKLKPIYVTPKPKTSNQTASNRLISHNLPAIMLRIRACESGNNYQAQNPVSTASGAFQIIDGTWARYMGYAKAKLAPPSVQDARALQIYNQSGTQPWVSSIGCWG